MLWRGALVCWLLAGCLPEAARPVGDHLIAQRGISRVAIGPGPSPLLTFTRAASPAPGTVPDPFEPRPRDLFVLPRAGGAERSLLRNLSLDNTALWDALGRLYVIFGVPVEGGPGGSRGWAPALTRWDPAAGEVPLGRFDELRFSAGRNRLYYYSSERGALVRELDDSERALGGRTSLARFLGEDLWFVRDGALVMLGREDREPVRVLEGVEGWVVASPPGAGQLVLAAFRREKSGETTVMIVRPGEQPPRTGIATGATLNGSPAVSSDGERVAFAQPSTLPGHVRVHVVRPAGGRELTAELPFSLGDGGPGPPGRSGPVLGPGGAPPLPGMQLPFVELRFRRGSEDVWCYVQDQIRVVRPDQVVLLEGRRREWQGIARVGVGEESGNSQQLLGFSGESAPSATADGRRWLLLDRDDVLLVDADDPAGPGFVVARAREYRRMIELPSGQLFAFVAPGGDSREDLHALDPATGERRVIARAVSGAVFGHRRMLAVVRRLGSDSLAPGDMVLVDLTTGQEQTLARNVTEFALAPVCAGCDRTAPGVAIVFIVNARVPFEHDGLWTAVLP
jgi:hypothetical protein